jgi:hypothetical protein
MFIVMCQPPVWFGRAMRYFMRAMPLVPFPPMWNVAPGSLRVGDQARLRAAASSIARGRSGSSAFRGDRPVVLLIFGSYT